jgi:hypothetical protein
VIIGERRRRMRESLVETILEELGLLSGGMDLVESIKLAAKRF